MSLTLLCAECLHEISTNGIPTHKILCKACHDKHTLSIIQHKDEEIKVLKTKLEIYEGLITQLSSIKEQRNG